MTGSNFETVVAAIERKARGGNEYYPSFFKTLKGEYNLSKKDAVICGQMHEHHALTEYVKAIDNTQ